MFSWRNKKKTSGYLFSSGGVYAYENPAYLKLCQRTYAFLEKLDKYRIGPNYHTVRLGFSNLQDTLICGQICIYLLRIHYKKDQKRTYLMMTMRFFLTFFTKAYVVGTHLNCIDLSMQFKWVPTTYAFVKKRKKYTGCNLKTTEFLDCAYRGMCGN